MVLPFFLSTPFTTSSLLPYLSSFKVTTSLRRKLCSYRRKTMRALALSLGEPKVGHFSKLHTTVCYIYTLFNLSIQALLSKPCSCTLSFAAQTPIEEFTPTPAFPALQYLESVDEGGVAWRAGLRMGDFLIEVRHHISEKLSY